MTDKQRKAIYYDITNTIFRNTDDTDEDYKAGLEYALEIIDRELSYYEEDEKNHL